MSICEHKTTKEERDSCFKSSLRTAFNCMAENEENPSLLFHILHSTFQRHITRNDQWWSTRLGTQIVQIFFEVLTEASEYESSAQLLKQVAECGIQAECAEKEKLQESQREMSKCLRRFSESLSRAAALESSTIFALSDAREAISQLEDLGNGTRHESDPHCRRS